MTGRERVEAAFSSDGAPEFGAVTCYQGIFLRDHWEQVTDSPWWALHSPEPTVAAKPWADMIRKTGEDWLRLTMGCSREERRDLVIEATPQGVFRVNRRTGERKEIMRPPIGGHQLKGSGWRPPAVGIATPDELDALIFSQRKARSEPAKGREGDGRFDLPRLLLEEFGQEKLPFMDAATPFWRCHGLWGFEELMRGLVEFPALIEHACSRLLDDGLRHVQEAAAAGAAAIWIEECMTDMVSPEQYRRFVLPGVRALTEAVRAAGMWSIHYYCGDPGSRWDLLLDTGADALALEEGKKGFEIDIRDVVERTRGGMTVFGNLDAVAVLERGSEEELRREIARQCRAGRKNRSRFVMSIGSPVTPATPPSRVRLYCDIVHEIGKA